MTKDTFRGCGTDASLFQKGQFIGKQQAEKAL